MPDSYGESVRVLCINAKTVAIGKFVDKTNNFRSNHSFGHEFFDFQSMMDSDKYEEYSKIGEAAVKSIGILTIAGIDILDSKAFGILVLEVNGWPELYDIDLVTNQDLFGQFANAYLLKCSKNMLMKNIKK